MNAVAFAVGAARAIVLARLLGATSRGEMVIASIGPIMVGVLCTLGIEESIVFLTAQSREAKKQHVIASSGLTVAVVMGGGGSLVALAIQVWYVGSRVQEVDRCQRHVKTDPLSAPEN